MKELFAALSKAQFQFKHALKSSVNPHFKSRYADLASVWDAVREPLHANGLCIMHELVDVEGRLHLRTILGHVSGESRESLMPVHAKDFSNPQSVGSAITYARRYALSAMLGIVADDDDDGNAAASNPHPVYTPAMKHLIVPILKKMDNVAALDPDKKRALLQHIEKQLADFPPLLENLDFVVERLASIQVEQA